MINQRAFFQFHGRPFPFPGPPHFLAPSFKSERDVDAGGYHYDGDDDEDDGEGDDDDDVDDDFTGIPHFLTSPNFKSETF